MEGDNSDEAKVVTKICQWSLPEPELKKRLWNEILDSKDSLKEL